MGSCRQGEVQSAELEDPKAGGDTLCWRERVALSGLEVLSHCECSQQKLNVRASCYITLTPPASVGLLSFSNHTPQESSTPFLFWDKSKKQPDQTEIKCCMNTLLAAKTGWISPWLLELVKQSRLWFEGILNVIFCSELKELGECVCECVCMCVELYVTTYPKKLFSSYMNTEKY